MTLEWSAIKVVKVVNELMLDGVNHFTNEIVTLVAEDLSAPHHLTSPGTAWRNGRLEHL